MQIANFTANNQLFYVIADPIGHVRAHEVFNKLFVEKGIDAVCVPLQIGASGLKEAVKGFRVAKNLEGCFVTIPHKEQISKQCDLLSDAASFLGAVNVIKIDSQGKITGENFDGAGFTAGLEGEGYKLKSKPRWLVIGAGGAAQSIAYSLSASSVVSDIDIVNRDFKRANTLKDKLSAKFPKIKFSAHALSDNAYQAKDYDAVVNCTSLGLKSDDAYPLDLSIFDKTENKPLICDIIMKPAVTNWLKSAQKAGYDTHVGAFMFDYQRDLIWNFFDLPL